MTKPLVSIVMPIYRVEEYIEKSVKSVIAQTYKNIELILVDDGSPDKSVEIAERVLKEHSFPYKLIRQENGGIGEARNTGIRNSNGKWVMFFDSDDILLPCAVESLVAAAGGGDLVFSRFDVITSQDGAEQNIKTNPGKRLNKSQLQNGFLKRKYVILASGTLFKRELIVKKNIYFERIPWSEDQHFIWRFLSVTGSAVYLNAPLYGYLTRPGSIMTSSGIEKVLKSYPAICELPQHYEGNAKVKRFLVARWVLGTVSSTAKIAGYDDWVLLYKKINAGKHMKTLLFFPDCTTRLRAAVCLISKKAYYNLFAKRT